MKEILEKLFATVDPEKKAITEEKRSELQTMLENKINELKTQHFSEAREVLEEEYGTKLEEILEAKDEEYGTKLEEILEMEDEKKGQQLEEILEAKDEENGLMLEEILDKVDEESTVRMQEIVEAIEEDHGAKLEEIRESDDADATEKLQNVIAISEDKLIGESLVAKVSDYLDTYLEEVKPSNEMVDAAKLASLQKFYESVKELALVNDEYVQTEIKEAVEDAQSQMDEQTNQINKLMMEKVELNNKIKLIEAKQSLMEKTKDMSPKMKIFVESFCKETSPELIEEKVIEATTAYAAEEAEQRTKLEEEVKSNSNTVKPITKEVITEAQPNTVSQVPMMEEYVKMLNKANKRS